MDWFGESKKIRREERRKYTNTKIVGGGTNSNFFMFFMKAITHYSQRIFLTLKDFAVSASLILISLDFTSLYSEMFLNILQYSTGWEAASEPLKKIIVPYLLITLYYCPNWPHSI